MYSAIDSNKRRSWILIGAFILLLVGLGALIDGAYDAGGSVVALAMGFSAIGAVFSYYKGDSVALWTSGAKEIAKSDSPELYRLVENLCIANGQPLPKIYIIDDPAPNAFATGRNPEHASVAFTTGILKTLDRAELEGVVAHELSHVKNYDILVMTVTVVLAGTIAFVADLFLRMTWSGGRDRKGGNAVILIIALVAAILAPIAAQLIKLAVSRRREYLADASGALLTRFPEGLARALEKISAYQAPMKHAHTATAHLYISSPFGAKAGWLTGLFSTHPPVAERVRQLREMAGRP